MNAASLRRLPAAEPQWEGFADVVVVGSGAAGLRTALTAAQLGRRVTLICKGALTSGSTPWAQGGLAAVRDPKDSKELHLSDTVTAGAGLTDESAARCLVTEAPDAVESLETLGARFDEGPLGLEGGHSRPRIIHAGGDASGAEVHRTLRAAVRASSIDVRENTVALDVLQSVSGRVVGVLVGRVSASGAPLDVGVVHASAVVLATGGFGHAYATTTNPLDATGDGVALAARAGAVVIDMEFVQFHPTVLFEKGARGQRPLITEALRGEGAFLTTDDGQRFMMGRHALADLAPRDVVAAEIQRRINAQGEFAGHVWLDARGVGRKTLERHFPSVMAACRARGVDPVSQRIPVAPGAHYAGGGVRADMDGRTSLPGLFAVGEVAATGVHGANRLASNSLTEALVTGQRLGRLLGCATPTAVSNGSLSSAGHGSDPAERDALTNAMSRHAGVARDAEGLEELARQLDLVRNAPECPLTIATVEATNLHVVSTLIAKSAAARTESRGSHRRSDYDAPRAEWEQRLELRSIDGELVVRAAAFA